MATRPAYERLDLSQTPLERMKAVHEDLTRDPNYEGWDTQAFRPLHLISADFGRVEFEFTVTAAMCNKSGNLSGGFAATVLDTATSMCLLTAAKPGFMDGGSVSRSLNCTFLRPLPIGSKVRLVGEVVQGGKTLSNVKGELRTLDGRTCVSCIHDKVEMPRANI